MSKIQKPDAQKIAYVVKTSVALIRLHACGVLGGEVMPEDSNPGLPRDSEINYLFFTLPMALNYQRNSYRLWESAKATYEDVSTHIAFLPKAVASMHMDDLRDMLLKHKVAIQPNRHTEIWMRICQTLAHNCNGSVKNLLIRNDYSVAKTKEYMVTNKKAFPYLCGTKIMNYWLYVLSQYTDAVFADNENITIAPDTHVLQASVALGLIEPGDLANPSIREIVSELWAIVLAGTGYKPIDIHTPLWLWSRGGFAVEPNKTAYTNEV